MADRPAGLRRLDYLPPWLAMTLGLALGVGPGLALAFASPAVAVAGFVALLGLAGALAWSGEPIEGVRAAEPAGETQPPQSVEQEARPKAEPRPPDPDPASPWNWVRIPAGSFLMGSPDDEEGRWDREGPVHRVRVSTFQCMRYQVTRRHYLELMGKDPGRPEGEADDRPVNNVSWHDAIAFCNRLSEREGLTPCYRKDGDEVLWIAAADGYRLPTEAEWEYACRAGSRTRWSFGDDDERLGEYVWFAGNSGREPRPVGGKLPNAWGLYDVHGNVLEWCWDAYAEYGPEPQIDPAGPVEVDSEVLRARLRSDAVLRGGSAWDSPRLLRSANRGGAHPEGRGGVVGFRCVRGPRRRP